MSEDLNRLLDSFPVYEGTTHYSDCHLDHPECAVAYLVRRVREAEGENEALRQRHTELARCEETGEGLGAPECPVHGGDGCLKKPAGIWAQVLSEMERAERAEAQIDKLVEYLKLRDGKFPRADDEHPYGMSAVEAAIQTMQDDEERAERAEAQNKDLLHDISAYSRALDSWQEKAGVCSARLAEAERVAQQLHDGLSWALDLLDLYDARLVEDFGEPASKVYDPTHLAGKKKAREALDSYDREGPTVDVHKCRRCGLRLYLDVCPRHVCSGQLCVLCCPHREGADDG